MNDRDVLYFNARLRCPYCREETDRLLFETDPRRVYYWLRCPQCRQGVYWETGAEFTTKAEKTITRLYWTLDPKIKEVGV